MISRLPVANVASICASSTAWLVVLLASSGCDEPTASANESQTSGAVEVPSGPPWGPWSDPVNLTVLNSASQDNQPTLSPDQLSLYFASPRPGGSGGNDIWVSRRESLDSPWEAPVNLGASINTASNDQGPSLSLDGLLLFFHSDRAGGHGAQDIYVARRTHVWDDFDWGTPVNLGSDVNTSAFEAGPMFLQHVDEAGTNFYFFRGATNNDGDIYAVGITRTGETLGPATPVSELNFTVAGVLDARATVRVDGRELYFFSNRPGGVGLADLYVSTRRDVHSPWSAPINLGPPLNTSSADTQPSLSTDGATLLFSSNRPGGSGNNDIWMSTRTRPSPE